jgi:hypothetical protein
LLARCRDSLSSEEKKSGTIWEKSVSKGQAVLLNRQLNQQQSIGKVIVMERTMERNVENLLCGGAVSNPEHKKHFSEGAVLSLDELDSVVGGKSSGKKKKKPESPTCPHCGPSVKLEKISGCEAKCKKCKKKFNLKAM